MTVASIDCFHVTQWHESLGIVHPELSNSEGRSETSSENFQDTNRTKSARIAHTGRAVSDLCSLICSEELGLLKLTASKNGLFDEGIELCNDEHNISLRAPSVPLARILRSADLKQDMIRKVLLSYLLAKAIWQFYDSDWMEGLWTKHTVHFMRQRLDSIEARGLLDHRPFISAAFETSLSLSDATPQPPRRTHIYPKILALGLVLLEIELGEGLENHCPDEYLDNGGQLRPNASHLAAADFLKSKTWKDRTRTLMPIRQAIEICLKPDTSVLGTDPTIVRQKLNNSVVASFAALFKMMSGVSPEEFNPGPIKFDGNGTFLKRKNGTPSREAPASETPHPLPEHSSVGPADNAVLLASNSKTSDSHSWLRKFDLANIHLWDVAHGNLVGTTKSTTLTTIIESNPSRPVRVAILDTGCDIDHAFFNGPGEVHSDNLYSRWWDCLDESAEPVDNDLNRHGTALTALMLRLVPGAEVYVVRIAKDLAGLAAAKSTIAKAIKQVTANWNVDIISMSFGFTEDVKSIRDAIIDAEKDHSVMFFAAANNDGLNDPEMFPAFMESVISVRGTFHDGSFDPQYNPKSSHFKPGPQYGSLARNVPCAWTSESLTKSGCSIATPIVAAIAAMIISFVDRKTTVKEYRDIVRTRRGMLSVFRTMTDDPEASRLYLAPWQLFENNRKPWALIEHALSNIPHIAQV